VKVGMAVTFQGYGGDMSDAEVWRADTALADLAEPMGFESIWATEHHFTNYMMAPDPLQFLTYMAGRTTHAKLGTMVTVLPWRDPVRVAENIILLDHVSEGRVLLGIGRGTGPVEFGGLRIPMSTSRLRFKEITEALLQGLESGVMEFDGELIKLPRVELRPGPFKSFGHRVFSGTMSKESAEIMARLGTAPLALPVKPWPLIGAEITDYRESYLASTGEECPPAIGVGWMYVDENEDRARENAFKYIGNYYKGTVTHYGFDQPALKNTEGYEVHASLYERLTRPGGLEKATEAYVDQKPWGTPEMVYDKIKTISEIIGADRFVCTIRFGGMTFEDGKRNMELFAREVMPELQMLEVAKGPEYAVTA